MDSIAMESDTQNLAALLRDLGLARNDINKRYILELILSTRTQSCAWIWMGKNPKSRILPIVAATVARKRPRSRGALGQAALAGPRSGQVVCTPFDRTLGW